MAIKKFETLDGINSTGAVVVGNTVTISGDLAVDTDTLYVDVSANNVGVNTTPNAAYALDVNGNMRATVYYGDGSNLTGVGADDASTLNGISSGSFLRSDVADSYESGGILSISNSSILAVTSGNIRLNDNQPLGLGSGSDVTFTYNGTQLNVTGSDISFDSDTLFIDVSADSVGVNTTPASGYALDVSGTMRATSFVGNGSQLTNITATNSTNANNATYFNTFSSSQFLRSDTTDTHTSGTLIIASSGLRVNDNTNLSLGTGANFTVNYDGTKVNAGGADLAIDTDTLYVDVSANRVGIGKTTPTTTLDVDGSVTATTYYGDGSNLTGISANGGGGDATTIDGLDSTQFLRSDTGDTHTSGTLIINSDGLRLNDNVPLRVGTGSDVQVKFDGTDLNITGSATEINISAGPVIASANVTAANFSTSGVVSIGSDQLSSVTKGLSSNRDVLSGGSFRAKQGYNTGDIDDQNYGFTFENDADTGMFNEDTPVSSGKLSFRCNNDRKFLMSQPDNLITANATFRVDGGTELNGVTKIGRANASAGATVYFYDDDAANTQTATIGGIVDYVSDAFRFRSASSNVQFYTSTSTLAGYWNGTNFTSSGNITAFSDERLKENVETLDGSKVYEMRGVSYTRDEKAGSGVIAQELQKVAPELVSEEGEYLSVAYGNLVGYLIEAIKDLKKEVEELKNANSE